MPKLTNVTVALKLPYIGEINGTWQPDETERRAAWEIYVELVTRISLVELRPGEGLLHEALASLYTLFETTRKILREYGPDVACSENDDDLSVGYLSIAILNCVIRPVLTKWHPRLFHHESIQTNAGSLVQYEQQWEDADQVRHDINDARSILIEYSKLLAEAAGVSPMGILS
jgi:hypothetical protein